MCSYCGSSRFGISTNGRYIALPTTRVRVWKIQTERPYCLLIEHNSVEILQIEGGGGVIRVGSRSSTELVLS